MLLQLGVARASTRSLDDTVVLVVAETTYDELTERTHAVYRIGTRDLVNICIHNDLADLVILGVTKCL